MLVHFKNAISWDNKEYSFITMPNAKTNVIDNPASHLTNGHECTTTTPFGTNMYCICVRKWVRCPFILLIFMNPIRTRGDVSSFQVVCSSFLEAGSCKCIWVIGEDSVYDVIKALHSRPKGSFVTVEQLCQKMNGLTLTNRLSTVLPATKC